MLQLAQLVNGLTLVNSKGYRIPGSKDRRIPVQGLMKFMQTHGIPLDGLMSGNTRVLIVDGDKEVITALEPSLH